MSRRDGEVIRARRARFISAALLVAGCSRDKAAPQATPLSPSESKPVAEAPKPPAPVPVKAPPNRPALDPKVTTTGLAKRAAVATQIDKVHDAVSETAAAVPAGCDLADPVCRARFKVFAERIAKHREEVYVLHPPGCPPKLADDIAIEKMRSEHVAWLTQWIDAIDAAARAQLTGDASAPWDELLAEARSAYAHPCLSFACP